MQYDLTPVTDRSAANGGPVQVQLMGGSWGDVDEFLARFEITNTGIAPYRFDMAEAFSEQKKITDVEVFLDLPSSDETSTHVIQPGKTITGVVVLPEVTPSDISPLKIVFSGLHGAPAIAAAIEWLIPRTVEDVIAERDRAKANEDRLREELARERAARDRADPESGKVSIQLQAIGGAIWLGNGLDPGTLDATSLKGFGVRVTYGFNRYFAFEGEAIGAGSGAASFKDTEVNGMQGELMRTASLGSVQLGGLVCFGTGQLIPVVRLGVGLQGAGYDSELMTATGPASMTDSGLELTTTLNFGAGLDVRLGDHFIVGFAASATRGDIPLQSIEAGIHAGYAWIP